MPLLHSYDVQPCVLQGYEKANATQDTMYQVRWGADYLMKMVGRGSGATAGNLDIIYQVTCP